jgi:hypothetical protein
MLEKRSLMSLLIGLTVCVSLWHIMLQQQQQEQFFDTSPAFNFANETITSYVTTTILTNSTELQLEVLPKNDFSQLIDLYDFEFEKNVPACNELEHQPTVVILVHSAPENFNKRKVIRETWGSSDARSRLIFLLGSVNSTSLQDKIDFESRVHEDVVQGNFKDAYRNMTYKHVMALKWFVYNCPNAPFLLKTDDDVFVNTPLLLNYLETPSPSHQRFHRGKLLFCVEVGHAKVKRTFRSKWRVSYKEYRQTHFPNHCPGFSILYSSDIVQQLYLKAQKIPYFWIDDVHITGNVASKLNITIESANSSLLTVEQQKNLLDGKISPEFFPFFFARPNLGENEIRKLWKIVKNAATSTNEVGE